MPTRHDYLKLWAGFVRLAGYKGLVVNVDELVVLSHRLSNTIARNKNYEALLRIINDCLQGRAQGIAFVFAGTDECIEDRRRGLFSYEALATRLAPNRFAQDGRQDWSSPVIKLSSLSPEDCFVLLNNIRRVHAGADAAKSSFRTKESSPISATATNAWGPRTFRRRETPSRIS